MIHIDVVQVCLHWCGYSFGTVRPVLPCQRENRQTLTVSIRKCASIAAGRLIRLVFRYVYFWFLITTHLFDVIAVLLGLLFIAFGLLLEQGLKTASKHYKYRHTIYDIRFTEYDMWCERIGILILRIWRVMFELFYGCSVVVGGVMWHKWLEFR